LYIHSTYQKCWIKSSNY